jgi:magnesium chelatase subunit D
MTAFRNSRVPGAAVCLPLTRSYRLAADRLRNIRLSGTTPLPDGIRKAYGMLRQARIKAKNAVPVMVIITDGLSNVPLKPGGDARKDILDMCVRLRREGIGLVVVDTEPKGTDAGGGDCRKMAEVGRGLYLPLSALTKRVFDEITIGEGNRP